MKNLHRLESEIDTMAETAERLTLETLLAIAARLEQITTSIDELEKTIRYKE